MHVSRLTRLRALVVAVGLLAASTATLSAEELPQSDEALLQRLFSTEAIPVDWIAPVARAELTPQLIAAVSGQLRSAAGELSRVERSSDDWLLTFERMTASAVLARNAQGQITGLFVRPPVPRSHSLIEAAGAISDLSGQTALLVRRGDQVLFDHAGGAPMLVGSAFKLAVLVALRDAIADGSLAWTDIVRLDPAHRSVPSGMLQDFPAGHPLTVATLAALMVSISDNTATDVLMEQVDPADLERAAGFAPVATTAAYFKLKAHSELAARYAEAETADRRRILRELADMPLPANRDLAGDVNAHGWRMSAETLCGLIEQVSDLDLATINTGRIEASDWDRVAFKGGSDYGVINLTYYLEPVDGAPYCVSASWHARDGVDETRFAGLVASVIAVLRDRGEDPRR